jgi:hypothetical protein
MIHSAEKISKVENAMIRQIKMRIESVKEVCGEIVGPEPFIERQLNRETIGPVSVNTMDQIIHWCATAILLWSVFGLIYNRSAINMFIGIGFALVLEAADYSFGTDRLRDELRVVLTDYIVNSGSEKKRASLQVEDSGTKEEKDREMQEMILNQVLGEYLP